MMGSHLFKRIEATGHANAAMGYLQMAMENLEHAEAQLKLSGYRAAARGAHQANLRVKSWMEKVDRELK
jgi:HEPN domain-containing protein